MANTLDSDIVVSEFKLQSFYYVVSSISFETFFVQTFKIVVDSWKFYMLLLYILWDDWPIFMISGLNEQLQQELEYTAGGFKKCSLDFRRTIYNRILF